MKETTIKNVFEQIEKNSQFVIFYNSDLINVTKKVAVDTKNKTVSQILDQLLKNTDLTYRIIDKQITIIRKTVQEPKQSSKNGFRVTGIIKSKEGEPLIGVNVLVKSSTVGTITDIDGKFEIRVPDKNSLLEISYIGFYPQSFLITESKNMTIVLKENTQLLDEVVVVGYGKQSKVSLTGSVASVSAVELKQSPVSNLSSALAGRLPGLLATQGSGEPGGDASTIWIRGLGTYSEAALKPLILVDGVERTFDDIDPNEIENISILKDASSTAVYGVQGANGVVLVTTKRGVVDKPSITASYQHSLQTPTRLPDYLDSYDALKLYREALINDGRDGEANMYSEEYLNKFRDRSNPTYQYLYPNVNWLDECLKDVSQMMKANVNVSGGSSMARYFVSVGYMSQGGLYKHADKIKDYDIQARTERYNFRSNIDLDLTRDLSMEVN
ncbi:MAG: SusC/RagA family TonB-linked outer membrane protein, partial [Bacteroidaceae bacterium]